jgi:hypothetical protein
MAGLVYITLPIRYLEFVKKFLKSVDDRTDKWKLSLECKIFIALAQSLCHPYRIFKIPDRVLYFPEQTKSRDDSS